MAKVWYGVVSFIYFGQRYIRLLLCNFSIDRSIMILCFIRAHELYRFLPLLLPFLRFIFIYFYVTALTFTCTQTHINSNGWPIWMKKKNVLTNSSISMFSLCIDSGFWLWLWLLMNDFFPSFCLVFYISFFEFQLVLILNVVVVVE